MKKILKYFLLPFFSILLLSLLLLQWSWFQKSCLLGILRCNFKEVRISDYKGNLKQITIGKVFCKNKTGFVEITDFKFDWNLWNFLKFKGVYINDLKGKILVDLPAKIEKSSQACQAGFFGINTKSKNLSFLSYVKLPFRLNVENLNLWMRGNIEDIKVENANLAVQHLNPNQVGICQYSSIIKLPSKQYSSVHANGNFNLKYNKNSQLENIKCNGNVRIFGNRRYPKIAYKGIVDGTTSKAGESLKLAIHCGQSSDFTLIGNSFKTTDHIFSLKWQTILDNSFLKLFDLGALPTLSVLAEGTCHLNRKSLTWNTHTYLSVWGKNFEAIDSTLKSLPYLSLKAQIDAEFNEKFLNLKQYKGIVKEKGVPHVYFDINSVQPITYDYKKGLKVDNAKNPQVLEINFYEVPFAFLNPYLQQYGYKLFGNLKSGNLNVSWDEKRKQCELSLLQPLVFYVQKFNKDKDTCLSDVNCRLAGKCALNSQGKTGSYNLDMLLTDTKHIPFFKFSQEGHWGGKKNYNTHKGDLSFSYPLAKNLIQFQPFGITINPDLIASLKYDVASSEDALSINRLSVDVKSDKEESIALKIDSNNPIVVKKDEVCFDKDGEIAHVYANQYPLDFIAYKDFQLKGNLTYEGAISKEKQDVKWDTKAPFHVKDLNMVLNGEDFLRLKQIDLKAQGDWKNKKQWSFDLSHLEILSEEGKVPLLSGHAKVWQEKDKPLATEGNLSLDVTQMSGQPFALKYPGLVGEIVSQWQFNDDKQIANMHANITPLNCPVTFDLKSFYTSSKKQLNSSLELRNSDHATDIQVDCSLEEDKKITAKINSNRIFVDDLFAVAAWGQALQGNLLKTQVASKESTTEMSSLNQASAKTSKNSFLKSVNVDVNLKTIQTKEPLAKDLKGEVVFNLDKDVIFKKFVGKLLNGHITLDGVYEIKSQKCTLDTNLEKLDLETLSNLMEHYKVPYVSYAQLAGLLDGKLKGSLDFKDWLASRFVLSGKAQNGSLKLFNTEVSFGNIMGGLATSIGLLVGGKSSSLGVINFLNTYLNGIAFERIEYNFERSNSDKLGAKVSIKNKDFALYTHSTVDTIKRATWEQYPLQSELQLYASTESPWLNYFNFEKTLGDHQEFLKGPTCVIDGTLGKPNYSNLMRLILSSDNKEKQKLQHPVGKLLNSLFN